MRFLIDHQLPHALADRLRALGVDADHVADLGLDRASDAEIWQIAKTRSAVIVSKDADFLDLAIRDRDGPAFVWIRLGNCRTPALLAALEWRLPEIQEALKAGRKVIEIR